MRAEEREDFAWLFRAHFAAISHDVDRAVGDPRRAADLTEQAFVRLWRHWDTPATRQHPETWVRRVAQRRAARAARRGRLVPLPRRPMPDGSEPGRGVEDFQPEVEHRLAIVVARQRRRERRVLAVVVPLVLAVTVSLVVAARGPGDPTLATPQPPAPADVNRPAIPDGAYATVVGDAEVRFGPFPAQVRRQLGRDHRLPVTLELFAPYYLVWVTTDAGQFVKVDYGTATYGPSGLLVLTSDGGSCPGCAETYRWTLDRPELYLTLVDAAHHKSPVPGARILSGHPLLRSKYGL